MRIEINGKLMHGGTLAEMAEAEGVAKGREVEMVEKDYLRDVLVAIMVDPSKTSKFSAVCEVANAFDISIDFEEISKIRERHL